MVHQLGDARIIFTGRRDGDMRSGGTAGAAARRAVLDLSWSWARQVHGSRVVLVNEPGTTGGEDADALVTYERGVPLAVFTADCAPVALAGDGGIAAVHAGWRGLVEGVVAAAADGLRAGGVQGLQAALGPCIHPECYEFSPADLDDVARVLGDGVRATSKTGAPALDLPAAVMRALDDAGVELVIDSGRCTACSTEFFSHRARSEPERQAMVVWRP